MYVHVHVYEHVHVDLYMYCEWTRHASYLVDSQPVFEKTGPEMVIGIQKGRIHDTSESFREEPTGPCCRIASLL